jgi:putative MATE family efflux protein
MNRDLTTGDPGRALTRFCLPLFGSMVFQQFYNIADSLVAGKFVGENALAAVGNAYEVTLIFLAFAFGCNIGSSVVTARLFGGKEYSRVKTAFYTTFIACGVLCAVLMAGGLLFSPGLIRLINTPDEIYADTMLYLNIYILGLPFLFFYNISTGIFSALGDSKTPFIFLVCSSLSNVAVDVLFVTVFKMGIAGVAWATFLCQSVSCILAVATILRRMRAISCREKAKIFSVEILRDIAVVAIPSILQQGSISVGNIIIQGVINSFGASVIAGYSAAVKLNNLVVTSFTTLGNGISNYTAQNLGAQKPERVRSGFFAGIKLVWALCVPIVLLYFMGGRYLLALFMDDNSGAAMATGVQMLKILSPFYFVLSAKLVSDGVLRGSSMMGRFMVATFIDLILRVVLACLLSGPMGTTGIWCAWPVGWSAAAILTVVFYMSRYSKSRIAMAPQA